MKCHERLAIDPSLLHFHNLRLLFADRVRTRFISHAHAASMHSSHRWSRCHRGLPMAAKVRSLRARRFACGRHARDRQQKNCHQRRYNRPEPHGTMLLLWNASTRFAPRRLQFDSEAGGPSEWTHRPGWATLRDAHQAERKLAYGVSCTSSDMYRVLMNPPHKRV